MLTTIGLLFSLFSCSLGMFAPNNKLLLYLPKLNLLGVVGSFLIVKGILKVLGFVLAKFGEIEIF